MNSFRERKSDKMWPFGKKLEPVKKLKRPEMHVKAREHDSRLEEDEERGKIL